MSAIPDTFKRLFNPPPVVSVVRLNGVIGAMARFGKSLEDSAIAPLVDRAFKPSRLAAVALSINSPGGSPVQSALIANRIRDYAKEKEIPVLAFVEDVAASGGYFLACAADEIYVEENSIVGSIGVISASFGFHEAIDKLGVERRLQTSGRSKSRLDPFQPQREEDTVWLHALQEKIHTNFINFVKQSRGDRIAEAPEEIFSGEVYIGEDARAHGLVDHVGRLRPTLRERYGEDVALNVVAPRRGLFDRFTPSLAWQNSPLDAHDLAAAAAEGLLSTAEQRALWARFGL